MKSDCEILHTQCVLSLIRKLREFNKLTVELVSSMAGERSFTGTNGMNILKKVGTCYS